MRPRPVRAAAVPHGNLAYKEDRTEKGLRLCATQGLSRHFVTREKAP
jgi:hypothetical protein